MNPNPTHSLCCLLECRLLRPLNNNNEFNEKRKKRLSCEKPIKSVRSDTFNKLTLLIPLIKLAVFGLTRSRFVRFFVCWLIFRIISCMGRSLKRCSAHSKSIHSLPMRLLYSLWSVPFAQFLWRKCIEHCDKVTQNIAPDAQKMLFESIENTNNNNKQNERLFFL